MMGIDGFLVTSIYINFYLLIESDLAVSSMVCAYFLPYFGNFSSVTSHIRIFNLPAIVYGVS